MSIKNICVLTKNYPDPWFIERGAFLEKLVRIWQSEMVNVDVVAPRSIWNIIRNIPNGRNTKHSIAGDRLERPLYLSFSNKTIGKVNFKDISRNQFLNATYKAVNNLPTPDLFYGQFLFTGGVAALKLGEKFKKPSFADVGESSILGRVKNEKELQLVASTARSLSGIVCVSEKLKEEMLELGVNPEKVIYHQNTVNLNRFCPMDKHKCREKLNLPKDKKIIIFVGHFIHGKGPLRLLKAIERLNNPDVKCLFIGRGSQKPDGNSVLKASPVSNLELPLWLNSADIFVLPTLYEGNCNAINEAMACGLPIISSDIPEVKLQVPVDCGILINPLDIDELANAIKQLIYDPKMISEMGNNALETQRKNSSKSRPKVILEWMNSMLESAQ